MSDGQDLDSQSFNKNYKILKETADWLSRQDEPDIDQLVPRIERAMRAYTTCKQRLNEAQATLGQALAVLALAVGGVAVAFGLVAFTPAPDLAQVLPVAVVITVAARLAAFAALRGAARKH